MATLRSQFNQALTNIEVNGAKRERAIAAHTEIRGVLEADPQLREWGIDTVLIGSYKRQTGIYPGKDVDVFCRFDELDILASPREVYTEVERVIVTEYGLVSDGGRASPQARSTKIDFPEPDDEAEDAAFSVDAVSAVHDGEHWAIPTKDKSRWAGSIGRWSTTNPERLAELSSELSTSPFSPTVGGRDAYKPVVKLMRQARRVHLDERRPGGLYVELAAYEVWKQGLVYGDEWDPLFARTLRQVARRLDLGQYSPLIDPALGTPVEPPVSDDDYAHAAEVFAGLAGLAEEALNLDDCSAAVKWREILGKNRGSHQVFPLPPGCDANGFRISAIAPVVGVGMDEARRFG